MTQASMESGVDTDGFSSNPVIAQRNSVKRLSVKSNFLAKESSLRNIQLVQPWTEKKQQELDNKRKLDRMKLPNEFRFRTLERMN